VPSRIRPFNDRDADAVVRLSLRAWAPVFASLEHAMGSEIYRLLHPDWRVSQRRAVEEIWASEERRVWVAEVDAITVGFVAVELHAEKSIGEIHMLAVDPDYQVRGVGSALTVFALDWMKEAGMAVGMVETGGDPGHAAARRTYEKAGYNHLAIARYFKEL
jgi:GNAT superfamily N-acetyltransferase